MLFRVRHLHECLSGFSYAKKLVTGRKEAFRLKRQYAFSAPLQDLAQIAAGAAPFFVTRADAAMAITLRGKPGEIEPVLAIICDSIKKGSRSKLFTADSQLREMDIRQGSMHAAVMLARTHVPLAGRFLPTVVNEAFSSNAPNGEANFVRSDAFDNAIPALIKIDPSLATRNLSNRVLSLVTSDKMIRETPAPGSILPSALVCVKTLAEANHELAGDVRVAIGNRFLNHERKDIRFLAEACLEAANAKPKRQFLKALLPR